MRTAANAVVWARGTSVWYPVNSCLNFVWNAFGRPDNKATGVPLGYALQSWQYTRNKHTGRDYPIGAPLYWSSPTNNYGHIAPYIGGGYVWSTYTPDGTHGVAGPVAISHIESASGWNHRYKGWGSDFAGYDIDFGTTVTTTSKPVTPVVTDDEEMISKETQDYIDGKFAKLRDDILRDIRWRLYINKDTGDYAFVNHFSGRFIYTPKGNIQNRWTAYHDVYEFVQDSIQQAHAVTNAQFHSLYTLSNGTDPAYEATIPAA